MDAMRLRPLVAPLALGLALATLAPVAIAAGADKTDKDTKPAASAAGGRRDPNNVTGISDFMEACAQGNDKFVAKDIPGAIELYQKAIKLQPRNALGHYLLGEAQFVQGNMQEAEKAWLTADQVADSGPPLLKAKVLFVLAKLKESQKPEDNTTPGSQKKWDDAKAAWQRYADFAGKHTDLALFPGSATSRMQMIDDMVKQDKAYDIVRQRIKEEKTSGAGTNK
jgi:tetratricopeptide (TPR) repeat protein